MLALPARVFLDTHIVIDAAAGHVNREEWERACCYLKQACRYCVSALTVTELIWALSNSSGQHFRTHQDRFRALLKPNSQPDVLDFIPYFTAQELRLPKERPAHLEDDFLNTIKLILAAPSKDALTNGFEHHELPNTTVKIRLDRFSKEFETNRSLYARHLESPRQASCEPVPPAQWTAALLRLYGLEADGDVLRDMFERLSAMYEFEMSVRGLLRNPNFKLERNLSDIVDGQQLAYLCDREVVFITNDSDFRSRVKTSPQRSRILLFRDLMLRVNEMRPLL